MIERKNKEILRIMAEGGKILAHVMSEVQANAREGVTLEQLDRLANRLITQAGATPAFLGYRPGGAARPYPATICASVNDVVVHGVPTKYAIKKGDLVKLDFGLFYKKWCVDAAVTVAVPPATSEAEHLVKVTREALAQGIEAMQAGNRLGDIGYAIERHVKQNGLTVVRGLTGHGIGKRLHEEPPVLNTGRRGRGEALLTGVTLALEPMITTGSGDIIQREDEGYATADGALSAHFEHTVAVTENGPVILTVL